MARQARGKLRMEMSIIESNTAQGIGGLTAQLGHIVVHEREMENGTSDGQIDRVWSTDPTGSVTAGTPVAVDLAGSLNSQLDSGVTVVVVDVVGLMVRIRLS